MDFEPDYDVYNEAPPEDEDDSDEMISSAACRQAFNEQLAQLVAELKQMRLLLVEIGRALAP
jgi:hypothetical protein